MAASILVSIRKLFTSGKHRAINLGALAFVLLFFFYINARVIFDSSQADGFVNIIEVYIIGLLIAVTLLGYKPDLFKSSERGLLYLIIGLFAGLFVTLGVKWLFAGIAFGQWGVSQTSWAILQIFVIGLAETLIFQGAIAGVFGWYGNIAAPITFGIFHAAVYQLALPLIISAIGVGALLQIVYNKYGAEATWGLHSGINLGLLALGGAI